MPAPRKTKAVDSAENKIVQLADAKKRDSRPASNPEAREQQLVHLAVQLAEKQLRDGSASPSVIGHFLKIASKREYLEREILEKQSTLLQAKASNITKDNDNKNLAEAAIEAMKSYNSGSK